MLNPKVIHDFLEEPTRNLNKYKNYPDDLIEKQLNLVAPNHVWKVKPYTHQKICFVLGVYLKKILYWLDMGTGKTSITINLLKYAHENDNLRNGLVLVPNRINVYEWVDEFKKHYDGDLKIEPIVSDTVKLRKMLEKGIEDTIIITTYMGFLYIVWEKDDGLTKTGVPRRNKQKQKGRKASFLKK